MNKKFYAILPTLLFCALLSRAQDTPSEAAWESDPLDVLDVNEAAEAQAPSVPEFQEVPEPEVVQDLTEPAPTVTEEVAPTPDIPASEVPTPPAMSTVESSEPDYSKEAEFHRIYKTYNEQPTSVEAWEKALAGRQSEGYLVQKGDTLSGISETFFGDPFFWPKVWSLNQSKILNPHEIKPGMNVHFFAGSLTDAPTLELAGPEATTPSDSVVTRGEADATAEAATAATEGADEAPAVAGEPTLPSPKKRTPLLKSLPDSLPLYRMGAVNKPPTELQIDLPKNRFPRPVENLDYYISDAAVLGVGEVSAIEMDLKAAGEYQYIFVRLNEGVSGKVFVAQKNGKVIKDPDEKARSGQMVEVQGEIELLERVSGDKNIYRAIVKKSLQPIEIGSILTAGALPMIDPVAGTSTSAVGAKIIGGRFDDRRALFSSNSVIFLNAGSNQGLQEGQNLMVYASEKVRSPKAQATVNDRQIGTVKVVKVAANYATAYVINAQADIVVGDYVGHNGRQALLQPSSSAIEALQRTDAPAEDDFELDFQEGADSSAPPASDGTGTDSGSEDLDLEF
ncbi:MAG: hypothetical protein AAGB31_08420 [Bdellovibrio sp.]